MKSWRYLLPLITATMLVIPALRAAEPLSVVANGEVVGSVVVSEQQGKTQIVYRVDDNGRGPKLTTELQLGDAGIPLSLSVTGTSLMGGQVAEHYRYHQGVAEWQSQADSGKQSLTAPRLYIVNDSNPWLLGVYARALLAQPQHRLKVLPSGELSLQSLPQQVLGTGAQQLTLQVYRLTGLSLQPSYLMLDQQQQLFAVFSATGVTLRQGYEAQAGWLQSLAGDLETSRMRELQQQLAHQPSAQPLRLVNVHVLQVQQGQRTGLMSLQIKNGLISAIEPWHAGQHYPGETVYDANGGTLIPGLHDMHSHSTLDSGLWYLAAGITSTRDMGNDNQFLLDLIPRIDSGEIAGPRIVRNGFLEGRSPYSARDGFVVDSEQDAVAKVRWYKKHGYWQIKIYNSMNPAWVPAITREAHRLGMTVTGHIPAFTSPDQMIAAGYDEITHANQLMLGWLLHADEDTRTPLRLTAMVRAADLDLNSEQVQRTLSLMQQHHIPLDPTAVILERLMLSRAGAVTAGDKPYLSHMPIGYQRYRQRTFVPGLTPALDKQYHAAFNKMIALLGMMHDKQLQLLPGTDDTTGFTVLRELELYVQAGMTPAEAVRAGTLDCERYLGREQQLGSLEVGKRADMVLLRDNPLDNISNIRSAQMVIKDDSYYFPAEIYQALGVSPFALPPNKL
ncbi:amidohydrolase family protein [Shewanella dokdonensis]|uniref:Amidohydrolase family protein n=1 Tax=Shewanella dokdonensis TaxID=712036 RepID=A0ABX8DBZ7_9GAMM|nr:amidohydrolase family protein [Shewanella dokdonensis]MCL1074731.1 amidohydrolase family protein [Shewanella dokdonensis]QVK22293.1 amidohydrolase family protein [Shewanella dokdonensis]